MKWIRGNSYWQKLNGFVQNKFTEEAEPEHVVTMHVVQTGPYIKLG